MTIALDATYSTGSHLSGVGVYCREVMGHLAQAHPDERFLHCYRPHRLWRGLREPGAPNRSVRPLWEGRQWFEADLFHGLNQRLPRTKFARAAVTFHDLFVLTAEYSTPDFRQRFASLARDTAARADCIICVSRFTADQVHSLLGVERARLRVVHHGARFRPDPAVPREPVVLHVGAVQKRKNLAMLVRAFAKSATAPWRLVLAGGEGFGAEEVREAIAQSPARDRMVTTGWVSDQELARWYNRASILAFPSLDEGFGIPAIEAMQGGLPVLASNRGALPEICGEGAWTIDAEREEDWAQAIGALTASESLRAEWSARGRAQKVLTWAEAAEQTWSVYRELLG